VSTYDTGAHREFRTQPGTLNIVVYISIIRMGDNQLGSTDPEDPALASWNMVWDRPNPDISTILETRPPVAVQLDRINNDAIQKLLDRTLDNWNY
jgi:hypothetical protein